MQTCPSCEFLIPDAVALCPFCQADVAAVRASPALYADTDPFARRLDVAVPEPAPIEPATTLTSALHAASPPVVAAGYAHEQMLTDAAAFSAETMAPSDPRHLQNQTFGYGSAGDSQHFDNDMSAFSAAPASNFSGPPVGSIYQPPAAAQLPEMDITSTDTARRTGYITAPEDYVGTTPPEPKPKRDIPWTPLIVVLVLVAAAAGFGLWTWNEHQLALKSQAAAVEADRAASQQLEGMGWQAWTIGSPVFQVSAPGVLQQIPDHQEGPFTVRTWSSSVSPVTTSVSSFAAPVSQGEDRAGTWARIRRSILRRDYTERSSSLVESPSGTSLHLEYQNTTDNTVHRVIGVLTGDTAYLFDAGMAEGEHERLLDAADKMAESFRQS